jgi:hypothetical protein
LKVVTRSTTVSPSVRVRTAVSLIVSRMMVTSKGSSARLAHHGDDDLGAHRAAHHVHRLVERQAQHAFAVDMGDEIARLDPGLVGGRVVDGRDDLDEALFLRDLDAQPAELAAGLHPHVGGVVGRR